MSLPERIYDVPPRIAMVIGTYGSLPYIHLQLEARKRFYPHIPALVHDDGSAQSPALSSLCLAYRVAFSTNPQRIGDGLGDMMAFQRGLEWARDHRYDLLVKVSRRFIPLIDWSMALAREALTTQYATFSHPCLDMGWGFRTEAMGMHVLSWFNGGLYAEIADRVAVRDKQFVEGFMHDRARKLLGKVCRQNDDYVRSNPVPADRNGYGMLRILGGGRKRLNPFALWHDIDHHLVYYRHALAWGLKYQPEAFNNSLEWTSPQ